MIRSQPGFLYVIITRGRTKTPKLQNYTISSEIWPASTSEMRSKQLHKFEKESKEMGKARVSKIRARHQIRGAFGACPKSPKKKHEKQVVRYWILINIVASVLMIYVLYLV